MTLNIRDAEDSILLGWDRAEKISKQFDKDWYAPVVRATIAATLGSVPKEVMDGFKDRNPSAYNDIMKKIGGG